MGLVKRVQAFWAKFSNDWCMNLSGLLAYNFLTAIFPLLLGILALGAFVLPDSVIHPMADKLNSVLPAGTAAGGPGSLNINFYTILQGFKRASGLTALVSLVGLLWTGSNLFGVMENCFSIVFRTRDRNFLEQKLMALVMILLFAILAPLSVFASTISGSFNALASAAGQVPGLGLVVAIGGYLIGVLFAFVLFFVIYIVVPNMPINPRDAWRGALLAAVLFELVNLVFPLYVKTQHGQFGQFALLLAILTFWFWVISLILLLGAELNSFAALGQRAAGGDLPTMLHDVQVHGAAPREGEDADAPPAGHPVSRQGERRHAATREEKTPTGETAAHPPGDPDRRQTPRKGA
jgi:membrane protein